MKIRHETTKTGLGHTYIFYAEDSVDSKNTLVNIKISEHTLIQRSMADKNDHMVPNESELCKVQINVADLKKLIAMLKLLISK